MEKKSEIWKDIKEYEGIYQISDIGRVKSLYCWAGNKYSKKYIKKEKILKNEKTKNGYYIVCLRHKNKKKYKTVHRLVAEAFIPNTNNYPIINHKDGNKLNNNINNLEWCTYKYNTEHALKNGLNKLPPHDIWKGKYGKEHNRTKKINQIDKKTNKIINSFYGVREASIKTGIYIQSIYFAAEGRRKTAGSFIWRYENE